MNERKNQTVKNTTINISKANRLILLFLFSLFWFIESCKFSLPIGLVDETIENIDLGNAQELVPFVICFPEYVPPSLNNTPVITYHAEWGDPEEPEIRLKYYDYNTGDLKLEIIETHAKNFNGYKTDRSLDSQESSVRQLLYWLLVDKSTFDDIFDRIVFSGNYYIHKDKVIWILSLDNPGEYQAIVIDLGLAPVSYKIYSKLPVDETIKIAESLLICSSSSATSG